MDKTQQVLVQQEIFGEKQILKMADFLQTDFAAQTKLLGGPSSAQLTPSIEKLGNLNDLKDALEARRELTDVVKKAGAINEGMVRAQDERAKLELEKENRQIKSYQDLAAISIAADQVTNLAKDAVLKVADILVKVTDLTNNMKKLTESRVVKGFLKLTGGGN
jgi:hypothetical protein